MKTDSGATAIEMTLAIVVVLSLVLSGLELLTYAYQSTYLQYAASKAVREGLIARMQANPPNPIPNDFIGDVLTGSKYGLAATEYGICPLSDTNCLRCFEGRIDGTGAACDQNVEVPDESYFVVTISKPSISFSSLLNVPIVARVFAINATPVKISNGI